MALKWYGEQMQGKILTHAGLRLEYAARKIRDHAREKLGKRYGTGGQTRDKKGRFRISVQEGAPGGEYPGMRTGQLRRNIEQQTDRQALVARVGTNVLYGKFLEFGTRRMAARPWLSRALSEMQGEIRHILESEVT